MNLIALSLRLRWLQLPAGILILLLQRTPLLRVLVQGEARLVGNAAAILRSAFAVTAMGAYNSVAGATEWNVAASPNAASPTSGATNETFRISATINTAATVEFTESGAPAILKSWRVTGTLPTGLSVVGGNPINVSAPYKMTVSGTPTTAGTYPVTVTGYNQDNATGLSGSIQVIFTVTGGAAVAPTFTTQPRNVTVTAGGPATFSVVVATTANPTPTLQWTKNGANISGATTATYAIAATVEGDAGSYAAVATSTAGTATSTAAILTVNPALAAPSITTQPLSQTVTAGNAVTFSSAASGNPTPTYQWQKGGVNISGATSATYTIASTAAGDAGNYAVVATSTSGSVTSATATLTVSTQVDNAPTTLAGRSAVVVVTNGSGVLASSGGYRISFSAASAVYTISSLSNVASSAGTYTYTKTGTNAGSITINDVGIGAATTLSLSFSSGSTASYSIAVTGGTQSGTAVFEESSVAADNALTAIAGKSAIVVISEGTSPLASIGGYRIAFSATTTAYTITPLSSNLTSSSGTYVYTKTGANTGSIAINDAGVGVATSQSLIFTSGSTASYSITAGGGIQRGTAVFEVANVAPISPSPAIVKQPVNLDVTVGRGASFNVAASGNPTPTYQWQKGGVTISGATSATYTIASTVAGDAGNYAVVVTNSSGSVTSATATLTVSAALAAPAFTTQPSSATVIVGGAATFTAAASGNPTPTYQWQKGGVTIAGATSTTYTIASTGTGDAGSYTVVATNSGGAVTSSAATLTVNPAPPVLPTTQLVITGKPVALGIVTSTTGTIKWQVSTDSGSTYTDLADNATYRGTTTAVLEILQATNALNNNRYRYQVTLSGQTTASTATTLSVKPAYLLMPVGLKIDSANNLYVTDAAAQVVVKITSDFKIASLAGTAIAMGSADGTGTVARFNEPTDLVINDDGSFLLTDTSNASLRKVTTAGVVTTFAGTSGSKGSADGTGAAARFSAPVGITRDTAGNVYVADQTNHVIRRVTPAGVVTTLAGTAGTVGSTDGTGAAARFNLPTGVAMNSADLIYVADFGSHTLRKVTSSGVVTTFAGTAGTSGSVDGTGAAARFNKPSGLALDSAGNLYVADTGNSTVRKVTPAGVVTTLAGLYQISGLKDGTGASAWFYEPEGLTSDTTGNLYIADTGNAVIRKVTPAGVVTTLALTGTAPVITTQPASSSVTAGNSASFSVVASSEGVLTYQWKKDGTDVAGATAATYAISSTATTSAGSYTVVVSNFLGSVTSSAATLTVNAVVVTPPPSSSGGGGGGGGGAVSSWFIGALGLLLFARRVRRGGGVLT